MMIRMSLIGVMMFGLMGCEAKPELRSAPTSITGKVVISGGKKPKNLNLVLQPMENGVMTGFKIGTDGTFTGNVIPGRYFYYFIMPEDLKGSEKSSALDSLKLIAEPYRSTNEANTVDVRAGAELIIEVN